MAYIFFAVLFGGLLMFLQKSNEKVSEIGRILFAAAVLAFLIAVAPLTVHLLHGG